MNHRDRDREQQQHRYARSLRDTYNPEPQWLRQDRENRTWASQRDEEFESGIGGSQYGGNEYGYGGSGRGSYAGSGREWGETAQGYNAQGNPQGYGSQGYGSQSAGTNRDFGGRDYGQRDQQRMREEREYQQRSFGGGNRGTQPREAPQDYRSGYEASGWDDNLDAGQRSYAPFHVGTGMGLGTGSEYGREREFGQSYGHSSGYGGHSGWDLGTHQRDIVGSPSRQSFRGMGPSHYKRADERIRDDIYERLTDSHIIDARSITVEVNEGNVTLTGTVNERRMRYAAEDLVERVGGVANINNQLRVQAQEETRAQSPSIDKTKQETKRH